VHNEQGESLLNSSIREYILEMIAELSKMAQKIDDDQLAESLKLVFCDHLLSDGMGGSREGVD